MNKLYKLGENVPKQITNYKEIDCEVNICLCINLYFILLNKPIVYIILIGILAMNHKTDMTQIKIQYFTLFEYK